MPAVVFVCTANICRSPMAEALFQARVRSSQPDWQEWLIDSAGTWATEGQAASTNSVKVMASRGLDISMHRSKEVSRAFLEMFDLVLVMEPAHKEALAAEFPEFRSKVFLLTEMSGMNLPVEDPYGLALEEYEKTAQEIEQYIEAGFPRILTFVRK